MEWKCVFQAHLQAWFCPTTHYTETVAVQEHIDSMRNPGLLLSTSMLYMVLLGVNKIKCKVKSGVIKASSVV